MLRLWQLGITRTNMVVCYQVVEAWPQWAAAGLVANPHFHAAALRLLNVLAGSLHGMVTTRSQQPLVRLAQHGRLRHIVMITAHHKYNSSISLPSLQNETASHGWLS